MGKGSSTKAQSSNPPWLDKAGEQNWGFAQDAFFNPSSSQNYYSKALAPWGYTPPSGQNNPNSVSTPVPGMKPASPNVTPQNAYYQLSDWERKSVPKSMWADHVNSRNQNSGGQQQGLAPNGGMSLDNLAALPMYPGQRIAGLSPNERRGVGIANDSVGITDPYFNNALGSFGKAEIP